MLRDPKLMEGFAPGADAPSIVSVTDRVVPLALGSAVASVHVVGDAVVFVHDEDAATFADMAGETRRVDLHGGAILAAASDGRRLVTGGDDGKVVLTSADGASDTIATDARRRWIDCVALHEGGALAWSAGKTAFVRGTRGEDKSFDAPTTVGGLAFAPKGLRLAIAHYNGVTLWFPNMAARPEVLEWAGSHLGVVFSPDGKFVVTTMHEPALHGWRLADQRHMRMTGYPGRVRSMAWSAGGKGLATSGADTVIVWPFTSKDGPMGKEPAMLAPLAARVSAVACHPKQDILAAGYSDGAVLMVRIHDGAEILVHRNGGAAITGLGWSGRGTHLAFAAQDGSAGLLAL